MRVGCGSATIGIFAQQWFGHVDEVVVVDDHITGVLTEHQAGRCLDMAPSGIQMRGRKSTPGRYFQVANPGTGWGGTDITDPLSIVEGWDAKHGARPGPAPADGLDHRRGRRRGSCSTTTLVPRPADDAGARCAASSSASARTASRRSATVLFLAGAGGSLRAGVTENPVRADALDQARCWST